MWMINPILVSKSNISEETCFWQNKNISINASFIWNYFEHMKRRFVLFFRKIIKLNNGKFWECTILTCSNWYCPKQIYLYYTSDLQWHKVQTRQAGWTWSSSLKNSEYWLMLVITELHPSLMCHHPRTSTGFYRHHPVKRPGITCLVIMWHRNDRTLCNLYFIDLIKKSRLC